MENIISTKNEWKVTENRFVAFLDIMGFKDLVMRKSHEEIYQMMNEISEIKKDIESSIKYDISNELGDLDLFITSFSDSIVIFTKDDSKTSFALILGASKIIIDTGIRKNLPMKGAISHGLISVNKDNHVFFGQPIIDAYLLQEEVNYYGVVFHNSIDKYIHDTSFIQMIKHYFETLTFLKSGQITHRNLNWFESLGFDDPLLKNDSQLFEKTMEKLKNNTSGYPRKYIDNTIEMFKRCKQIEFKLNVKELDL